MAKGGKGRKGGGGGGGKTRKYTRDNNGRFASTGTGATARGGRLLTAKGNKRTARALAGKTKTIEATGQKGVLAKPKGLKPGAVKAAGKPTKAAKLNTGPAKPKSLQSKDAQSDRLDVAGRKKEAKALLEMSKPARKAVRVSLLARRAGFGGAGVSTDGRKKGSSSSAIANIDSGRMRLISDSGKRKGKLTAGQRQANERTMITSGKSLQARLRTKQIGAKVKGMGGDRKTMAAAAKPKSVITKAKPKAVAAAKPKTQKERWAARAKMLNNAADKNDAKAKRLRDANDTTGNTAFNTQPGKIPGRARMNAASERSFRMNEKAQQQRSRADNLNQMATTNKGDAAKGRAARAEQVKTSYGGIKKGQTIQSEHGEATVIKANAKTVTYQTKDGSKFTNRPYEFQKPKPATQGSSKVVDSAKVNRMAERLGAKARAPKNSSPVKNANTVATRAKALAFLKGKGGTFPNAAAVRESIAANIRNRQVFSTGKKAAPKAAKAPKGGMRATKRNPLPPDSTIAKRLAMFKSDKQLTDQRTKSLRAGLKKETDPVQKIKTSSNISESQLKSKSYGDDITRMQARPIMGKRTGSSLGDKPVSGPAAKRPNTIKGKPKRDAGVAAKVKPGINLNAKKYPAIYRDRANTKGKAAAKAAKRPMR